MWGSLDHQKCPAIRRYGGVDSLPVAVWHGLSEGYDGGVSGHNGPGEQLDAVLVGAAREGEGGAPGECSAHLALALGKGKPFFVGEPSIAGHVDRGGQ